MAVKIDSSAVEKLLGQIDSLGKTIETAGDEARKKRDLLKVEELLKEFGSKNSKSGEFEFDAAGWSDHDAETQEKLHSRLAHIRDSLHSAATLDGPTDPKHIMYSEYASNRAIIICGVIGLVVTILLLTSVLMNWDKATSTDYALKIQAANTAVTELDTVKTKLATANARENETNQKLKEATEDSTKQRLQALLNTLSIETKTQQAILEKADQKANSEAIKALRMIRKGGAEESFVLLMVVLLGALGGGLHLLASLVKYVGNRQLKRSWLLHYLSMPIVGAVLAPIVFMLLRVGVLAPGSPSDGSSISNLNLIGIYAFAILTGLFAKTATEKLSEVFSTLFRTSDPASKDSLGAEKPPGSKANE